jgi:hypothetical protein
MADALPIQVAPSPQPGNEQQQQQQGQPKKELKTAEDVFEPHILAQYDPDAVRVVLRGINAGVRPLDQIPIAERRANPARFRAPWAKDATGMEGVANHELVSKDGATFPVRVYHPDLEVHGQGPYGVHLNFHGELFSWAICWLGKGTNFQRGHKGKGGTGLFLKNLADYLDNRRRVRPGRFRQRRSVVLEHA